MFDQVNAADQDGQGGARRGAHEKASEPDSSAAAQHEALERFVRRFDLRFDLRFDQVKRRLAWQLLLIRVRRCQCLRDGMGWIVLGGVIVDCRLICMQLQLHV